MKTKVYIIVAAAVQCGRSVWSHRQVVVDAASLKPAVHCWKKDHISFIRPASSYAFGSPMVYPSDQLLLRCVSSNLRWWQSFKLSRSDVLKVWEGNVCQLDYRIFISSPVYCGWPRIHKVNILADN